jgi:hypothetical protein
MEQSRSATRDCAIRGPRSGAPDYANIGVLRRRGSIRATPQHLDQIRPHGLGSLEAASSGPFEIGRCFRGNRPYTHDNRPYRQWSEAFRGRNA